MMQRREQIMLGVLLAAVIIWQGSGWVYSAVFGPFETRFEQLRALQKSVTEKEDQLMLLARAGKTLKAARQASLPPDVVKGKRPDALNAQRLYLQWLTDLAELCEIEDLKVTPDRRFLKGNEYVSVVVRIEADARYAQLVRFLDLFNRTDLLHRITSVRVNTKEFEGDPILKVTLEAEGIALVDAPARQTLFPQAELSESLTESGTTLQIEGTEDFPKQPGFRIRIQNEFMTVTAMDAEGWTITRAVDRTLSTPHPEGTLIELVRQKADSRDPTPEEFSEMIADNIFLKPAPPYKIKLIPLPDKAYSKGKPIEFTISAVGYDAAKGRPEFSLVGDPLPDLKLEKSGKLTWKPGPDVKPDKYPIAIEVRHPSAPQGVLSETISIRLKESTVVPKLATTKPPVVYPNTQWKFQPQLAGNESNAGKFNWKLGPTAPAGVTIDAKTGELSWNPNDEILPGEMTIPIIVTDSETPPQSTTLQLKIDVQDDEASFTRLDTIFILGEKKRAFLYDPSRNKKTELKEGDEFTVADISGTVKQIRRKYIILAVGQREIRVDAGQSLREAQTAIANKEDAGPRS